MSEVMTLGPRQRQGEEITGRRQQRETRTTPEAVTVAGGTKEMLYLSFPAGSRTTLNRYMYLTGSRAPDIENDISITWRISFMIYSKALDSIRNIRIYTDKAEEFISNAAKGKPEDKDKAIIALKQIEKAVYEAISTLEINEIEKKIKEN